MFSVHLLVDCTPVYVVSICVIEQYRLYLILCCSISLEQDHIARRDQR